MITLSPDIQQQIEAALASAKDSGLPLRVYPAAEEIRAAHAPHGPSLEAIVAAFLAMANSEVCLELDTEAEGGNPPVPASDATPAAMR